MRSAVWGLAVLAALAALLPPGRSDCLGECRACRTLDPPDPPDQPDHALSTLVKVCYLECSGHLTSSFLWELCQREAEGSDVSKREEVVWDREPRYPGDQATFLPDGVGYDSLLLRSTEEEEESLEGAELSLQGGVRTPRDEAGGGGGGADGAVSVSKRFGGFLRGRQGYRKLVGARPLQKRYGGFIGVRKSARKWNSQKRVNQLLRQYLGLRNSRGGGGRYVGVPMATLRRSGPNL